jgi:hypothetical protein
MYRTKLAAADIKAICRARGFSEKEAGASGILENFLLSDIGVADVLENLHHREILLLHLLRYLSNPVGIDVFERISDTPIPKYGSFTETYEDDTHDDITTIADGI